MLKHIFRTLVSLNIQPFLPRYTKSRLSLLWGFRFTLIQLQVVLKTRNSVTMTSRNPYEGEIDFNALALQDPEFKNQ